MNRCEGRHPFDLFIPILVSSLLGHSTNTRCPKKATVSMFEVNNSLSRQAKNNAKGKHPVVSSEGEHQLSTTQVDRRYEFSEIVSHMTCYDSICQVRMHFLKYFLSFPFLSFPPCCLRVTIFYKFLGSRINSGMRPFPSFAISWNARAS